MPQTEPPPTNYGTLDSQKIVETIVTLERRIAERFKDSGLRKVCNELIQIADNAKNKSDWIGQPILWLRVLVWAFCTLFIVLILASVYLVVVQVSMVGKHNALMDAALATEISADDAASLEQQMQEFMPNVEAELNVLVLLGGAVFFLLTIEGRFKRKRALAAIDELRSIAHIIDMHQLTKDPENFQKQKLNLTLSSPDIGFTQFELRRYLDYCSEMLSLVGKIAAIYVQQFDDLVALASANEVESLTTGLSRKIWQKLLILHTNADNEEPESPGIQTQ